MAMSPEELVAWELLSKALNLDAGDPVHEQTDEEKMAAYWDRVFDALHSAERMADRDALAFGNK